MFLREQECQAYQHLCHKLNDVNFVRMHYLIQWKERVLPKSGEIDQEIERLCAMIYGTHPP